MSDQPENLMLVYLRRLDTSMGELRADVAEIKQRLTTLEIQVSQLAATEASHYVSIVTRLDRIETRLDRLERHADTLPA